MGSNCMNNKGQSATEFILVLPWLCAALLAVVILVELCMKAQLSTYTGFMANRVYGVWPENFRDDMVNRELRALSNAAGFEVTDRPLEPMRSCEGEDNPLPPIAGQEVCL